MVDQSHARIRVSRMLFDFESCPVFPSSDALTSLNISCHRLHEILAASLVAVLAGHSRVVESYLI